MNSKLLSITKLALLVCFLLSSCTSQKKISYLNNLPSTDEAQLFPYSMQDYRVQYNDILYVDIKVQTPEGKLESYLQGSGSTMTSSFGQGESFQYLMGYTVDKNGEITLPVLGKVYVGGMTMPEIRTAIRSRVDSVLIHAFTEVKLLSFRYTVLGEARNPGTFTNYKEYLTVLEAIGNAGGVGDYGHRDRVLVVRNTPEGAKTYRLNLQDKNILSSEAYFLMPNDVVIIEPTKQKILNLNLPTITFITSTLTGVITTTLLLINYFGK